MEIATVRDAIITQLQSDHDLTALIPIGMIGKGLGKRINVKYKPRSIRVIAIGRGHTEADAEEFSEFAAGMEWVKAIYFFHVVCIFQLNAKVPATDTTPEIPAEDETNAEDYHSTFDRLMRRALMQTVDLAGLVLDVHCGRTFFRSHPEEDDVYIDILEVATMHIEQANVR